MAPVTKTSATDATNPTADGSATPRIATRAPASGAPLAPEAPSPSRAQLWVGLTRLATDGFVGVVGTVEAMHREIARRARLGVELPAPLALTPWIYGRVRSTGRWVGRTIEVVGERIAGSASPQSLSKRRADDSPIDADSDASRRPHAAWLAALNGVWGDHLARTGNPLALPMSLHRRTPDPASAAPAVTGRIVVLVHGLAMNDRQWTRRGHDHGEALARDHGFTPVYARYNTGLPVAQNGRALSRLLDEMVREWPVPVDELVLIGHSMGGLVLRSACHVGRHRPWHRPLRTLVCLGTPHHGAPLERAGALADGLLDLHATVAPLARVARARSAGITDLRFGHVQDADGSPTQDDPDTGGTASTRLKDGRVPTPLPDGVRCCVVAATTRARADSALARRLGDGLVPIASALGDHRNAALTLRVPPENRLVVTSTDHWDLLSSEAVYRQLSAWIVASEDQTSAGMNR